MGRRFLAVVALAGLVLVVGQNEASAHASFLESDPVPGSTLEVAPTAVRLVFSEEPEPALSDIRIVDSAGTAYQAGTPQPVPGEPNALAVPVRPLDRSLYTVSFRVVSAVDGHPTAGAFVFGVGVSPAPSDVAVAQADRPALSWLEVAARWIFVIGLVTLLGAASAGIAGFGRTGSHRLPAAGWVLSAIGLLLLVDAQRRNTGASVADLWATSIGRALGWRAAGVVVAGIGVLVAMRASQPVRQAGRWLTVIAVAVVMAVHVAAGHAAGGGSGRWASIAIQWAHFVGAGVWIGGLAALLVGLRGASPETKASAVRRFSTIAAAMLLVVVATGLVRAFGELETWGDLTSTGYGRAVVAKAALLAGIAGLAAANRWRNVPKATTNLAPLRRAGGAELTVAVGAMLAAALLGSLPPPAKGLATEPGIIVSGADYATTVRVELTAASVRPGPNRFAVHVVDYDSGDPVAADAISLEFAPLDDPGVAPTTLPLEPGPDQSFVGSGANLAFDGRWRVSVLIQRGPGSTVVPVELEARGPPQFQSVERIPGQPVRYTIEAVGGFVRVWADPGRAGPTQLFASILEPSLGDELAVEQAVITLTPDGATTEQQAVRRLGPGRFVADVTLERGTTTVAVVARTAAGARLRATVDLEID